MARCPAHLTPEPGRSMDYRRRSKGVWSGIDAVTMRPFNLAKVCHIAWRPTPQPVATRRATAGRLPGAPADDRPGHRLDHYTVPQGPLSRSREKRCGAAPSGHRDQPAATYRPRTDPQQHRLGTDRLNQTREPHPGWTWPPAAPSTSPGTSHNPRTGRHNNRRKPEHAQPSHRLSGQTLPLKTPRSSAIS
jgi:hypothetical protein